MIPKPIYESLPILYIVTGIAAMLYVTDLQPFLCGLILSISGITILFLRRNYRNAKQRLQTSS